MTLNLTKVEQQAPGLISLAKTAAVSLDKKGLATHRAAVYLVLDHSGSMSRHYSNGNVQKLAEQTLALSANVDDDGTVPVVFFEGGASAPIDIDLASYQGAIDRLHNQQPWGGTQYSPAMQRVIDHYTASGANDPALVVFQTDGEPIDEEATKALLKSASKLPIFWSFVGFGNELTFLRKLDTLRVGLGGRKVDNASLFETGLDPRNVTDDQLYDGILHEYPSWLADARAKGILH